MSIAETTLEESKGRLIAALEVWQESIDPCEQGHVEHGVEAHMGRRLVHTMAGSMGADWDHEDAVAFIRAADAVVKSPVPSIAAATGHGGAARTEGRWIAFATKADRS